MKEEPGYLIIKDALTLDPSEDRSLVKDVWILGEEIVEPLSSIPTGAKIIQADSNKWLVPGLVDIHCHLRDPGFPEKETIESGTRAAVAGGFTLVCPMANTKPVIDSHVNLEYVKSVSSKEAACQVLQHAALTEGLSGEKLSQMKTLAEAGAVAFSDDGVPYQNLELFKLGLQNAATLEKVVVSHAEEASLFVGGSMHEGLWSLKLGLKGIPSECESIAVAREIEVLRSVSNSQSFRQAHLHFSHISSKKSLELIKRAKEEQLNVTAETTPHHIFLTEAATENYNTRAKMNPPLRTEEDRLALIEAILEGTLDTLATDHAPHTKAEKERFFQQAPFGITGFETALSIYLEIFIHSKLLSPLQLVKILTTEACRCLKIKKDNSLQVGAKADLTLIDPDLDWSFKEEKTYSKSINSPFYGRRFQGKAIATICHGKIKYQA